MKDRRSIPKLEHLDLFHQINDYLSNNLNEDLSSDVNIDHEKVDYFVKELKLLDNVEKSKPESCEINEAINKDNKLVVNPPQEHSSLSMQEKKSTQRKT